MKIRSDKIVQSIKEYLELCLAELYEEDKTNDFLHGQKTAYVDCLEYLQGFSISQSVGLCYDVENRYPLLSKKEY